MFTEKLCSGIFRLGTKIKSGITETEKVQNVAEGEYKRHNLRGKKKKASTFKNYIKHQYCFNIYERFHKMSVKILK